MRNATATAAALRLLVSRRVVRRCVRRGIVRDRLVGGCLGDGLGGRLLDGLGLRGCLGLRSRLGLGGLGLRGCERLRLGSRRGQLGGRLAQLADAGLLADLLAQVVELRAVDVADGPTSIFSILGEWTGNVRSTPTPKDCLRTVNVSRTPEPWRLITIPSNTWTRRRRPRSPGSGRGRCRPP